MTIEEEESPTDRVYRYARIDLTSALEHLATRAGIALPPRRLFTKEDYLRTLALAVVQRQGTHALDAASSSAAAHTRKLFPGSDDIVAMCHSHFIGQHIQ